MEGCHQRDNGPERCPDLPDHLEKSLRTLLESLERNLYRYVKARLRKRGSKKTYEKKFYYPENGSNTSRINHAVCDIYRLGIQTLSVNQTKNCDITRLGDREGRELVLILFRELSPALSS